MKANPKFPILVTVFILLAAGCKKDKTQPSVPQTLLTKFTTATSVSTYSYDEQNRATQMSYSNDNPALNYTGNYTYNSSGTLEDFLYDYPGSAVDYKYSYFYNTNGQLTKIEVYRLGDGIATMESKTEADYSTPGKVSSYLTLSGGERKLVTEFYLNAKGNIIRQLSYSIEGELQATTENADFDDNHVASESLPKTAYARSVNNYQKVTVKNPGHSPSTNTYTYEYNSDGYPTKRTTSAGVIYTYEYIKK
ncbi:hypothetical protein [Niabella aurantiaca]|uniref:hypothetical protein n=1 Tax=Niabella aurantiaca TaxID=379900 RepID=UPI000371FA02|nr:hypothetical protein [Niabella aurantiaca]